MKEDDSQFPHERSWRVKATGKALISFLWYSDYNRFRKLILVISIMRFSRRSFQFFFFLLKDLSGEKSPSKYVNPSFLTWGLSAQHLNAFPLVTRAYFGIFSCQILLGFLVHCYRKMFPPTPRWWFGSKSIFEFCWIQRSTFIWFQAWLRISLCITLNWICIFVLPWGNLENRFSSIYCRQRLLVTCLPQQSRCL